MEDKTINAAVFVDLGDNLTNLVEQLAIQIGTTADKIFPWYVQQQVIEGWTKCALLVFLISTSLTVTTISFIEADYDRGNSFASLSIIFGLVTLFSLFVGAVEATSIVGQIMNPNYYAMQELTADLAQLVK